MADVEFDVGDGDILSTALRAGDEAWATMWCGSPADLDLRPWDAACSVDEEVFEQVRCEGHVSIW